MDAADTRVLEALQVDIPVCLDPWGAIGESVSLDGADVLDRVRRLKEAGVIRQISPIFDSRALGYSSVLVAGKVQPTRIEDAAREISAHPGVSHNYEREAEYNLWFTLAVEPGKELEAELAALGERAGLLAYRALPATRTFRIGVRLDVADGGRNARPTKRQGNSGRSDRSTAVELSAFDKQAIAVTQDDLALSENPFAPYCDTLGMTIEELAAWMARMSESGALRRFAAILRHREIGFVANGMGVWRAPLETMEQAGRIAGGYSAVTHCYERPMFDDWPYNLYTMIHARSQEACEAIAREIAEEIRPLGVTGPRLLYSTREFKKQRVRYFV